MKIKYILMTHTKNGLDTEVKRFDSYEAAENYMGMTPKDMVGKIEFYIKKVYIF